MPDDADFSLPAIATLVADFLTELDLRHVTLVCNDWGGAQLVISPGGLECVANLVPVSCEAPTACDSSAQSTTGPGDLPGAESTVGVVVAPLLALGVIA